MRHLFALIRFHHKMEPWELVSEDPTGELDFSRFVEVWHGLEWVLKMEHKLKVG